MVKNLLPFILFFQLVSLRAQESITTEPSIVSDALLQCSLVLSDVSEAQIVSDYTARNKKMRSVWLHQYIQGVPIDKASLQLVYNAEGKVINSQCNFISNLNAIQFSGQTWLSNQEILQKALMPYGGFDSKNLIRTREVNSFKSALRIKNFEGEVFIERLYQFEENQLRPIVKVRLSNEEEDLLKEYVLDGANAELLKINNLTVNCASHLHNAKETHTGCSPTPGQDEVVQVTADGAAYRVFPFPYESPLNGPRILVTNPADSEASPYGWHDLDGSDGPDDTQSIGNNVFAYDDQNDDDFPDNYVDGEIDLQFDFPFAPAPEADPQSNRDAAITNLFFANNRLHDVLYYYGFDENSGNFQLTNYGNASGDNDAVNAEGFDGSGINNANFGTPPDGEAPRMQMYLWQLGGGDQNFIVNAPGTIQGAYYSITAVFGAQFLDEPITADVVLVDDPGTSLSIGCDPPTNNVSGKIALIDRGTCNFTVKVLNAQNAGALAVVMINNVDGAPITMGGQDGAITIPSIMISIDNGNLLKEALTQGTVNATITLSAVESFFDSNFENGVIAHEFGHGVSNRLTAGPNNVSCLFNEEQPGEGWSDFIALAMTTTASNFAEEPRGVGNYLLGSSLVGPGIRPFQYTRDMEVNPMTYDDIQVFSIPHGLGSVWCTMLWDLYWNLVDVYGFDSNITTGNGGNNKAIQLVMDGLRLQPCGPGFVDARDAILLADEINYGGENACLIWETFARRGLGYLADQGSSDDAFDGTESYELPPTCGEGNFADFTRSSNAICFQESIVYTDISDATNVTSREWVFEGGEPATSSEESVEVVYPNPGVYSVTLTVTSDEGVDDKVISVTISSPPAVTISSTEATVGESDGSATISASGGLSPYQISWSEFPGLNQFALADVPAGEYSFTITDAAGCKKDSSVVIGTFSSIYDVSQGDFNIYPNPFAQSITISSATEFISSVSILDYSGRVILRKSFQNSNKKQELVASQLSAGIYLIEITTESGNVLRKRLVKN
jgi:extracellular elastinolytic metalloproteinase